MVATKILSGAVLAGLAVWGANAHGSGSSCANAPPALAFSVGSSNGLPALLCDVTDADGASDLLGYGFNFIMDNGKPFPGMTQLTLWLTAKKRIRSSVIPNGKRIVLTELPSDIVEVRVTATDRKFQQSTAGASVPGAVTAGQPRFSRKK